MSRWSLPAVPRPEVSVLMLTYGARDWVAAALDALVANTPPVYELVVVDNASPDGTGQWLESHLAGATLVGNPRNVGFGPGHNQAALLARGRYLCILNSDALVEPGWLEPLLRDLAQVAGCGAVVPCFVNMDASLQEAGAVIGREAWTMAVGYGDDPRRPWYRFPRFVDYGSGACLCLARSTFLSAGGFDPCYGAGYYEDVDLCFRLRQMGLRIVYEPRSVVRHVRGASSATTDVIRLRDANAERFARRWSADLARRPSLAELPSHPYRVAAARDFEAPDSILVMAGRLPAGPGDDLSRLVGALASAAGDCRVTLLGLDHPEPAEALGPLMDAGVEIIWGVTDWDDWMARSLCHYSLVVLADPSTASRAAGLVDAYQPQALLVVADLGGGTGEAEGRADSGPASGLPPEVRARVEAFWPVDRFLGPGGEAALVQALAALGIEASGPAGW